MKSMSPLILMSLVFLACLDAPTRTVEDFGQSSTNQNLQILKEKPKTHYYVDGKTGLVVFQKDFPSDWDIVSKPIYNLDNDFPSFLYLMQNDKGMKGFNTPIQQFVSFQNQEYAQMMQSYGMNNIRTLVSPNTIIEHEIKPMMELNGFKYLSQRQFPDVMAHIDEQRQKLRMPNMDYTLYCTEWINKDHIKALVTFSQMVLNYPANVNMGETMQIWNYQVAYFFAPLSIYENDLKSGIQADLNKIDSPNWQKYQMQVNNFRQQQSTAQHNDRMRNQQQQFDQHQAMMKDRYAANDANHENFMNILRNTPTSTGYSSDANHTNFIDMIREEQNVNLEGKTFKVEAGAENYWMNSDGKYIKSNNQFYDPNRDALYDNQRWDLTTKQK